jgi:hypothetical protein
MTSGGLRKARIRVSLFDRRGVHLFAGDRVSVNRAGLRTIIATLFFALAVVVVLVAIVKPWRYAHGNPSLSGDSTATTSARVSGGCSPKDGRFHISCVQYLDFDAGEIPVRHGAVRITDNYRRDRENASNVPVVYNRADPTEFRLRVGNPSQRTQVIGTAFITFLTVSVGASVGGFGGIWLMEHLPLPQRPRDSEG